MLFISRVSWVERQTNSAKTASFISKIIMRSVVCWVDDNGNQFWIN